MNDVADHFGTVIVKTNKHKTHQKEQTMKRIFSDINILRFKDLLNETDFLSIYEEICPDKSYNNFIEKCKNNFDIAFPSKKIKPNKEFVKRDPWMTLGLLTSLRTKSKLLNKKLKNPTPENVQKHNIFNTQYNKLKRAMKINYYKTTIEANKHCIKSTWKTINQAIGKPNSKTSISQYFTINNNNISDRSEIAKEFNNYFSNIGRQTSQKVPISNKRYTSYLTRPSLNSMYLEPIQETDIINIVNKLKPKTSSGQDEISTKLTKLVINNIISPLTYLINKSLESGIVPQKLKIAKVIPIFKASENNLLKNYRPISLLPAFSKIYQKIMFNKIMSFLTSQNALYLHEYGFRPNHATIHPIIHLLNDCAQSANKQPKEYTATISCDRSKAFDVISHEILTNKLEYYGLRGLVKDWLVNYLTDGVQYVEVEHCIYSTCSIYRYIAYALLTVEYLKAQY